MDAPSKLVIPLGSLDGLPRGTAVATTVSTCQVVQEDTRLRAAGSASRRAAGRAESSSYRVLGMDYLFPTCLAGRAPLQVPGIEVEEVRCDRRATPSAEPRKRPAARPQRGVPAQAGTRDRSVPARGPRAATVLPVRRLAAFRVAQR